MMRRRWGSGIGLPLPSAMKLHIFGLMTWTFGDGSGLPPLQRVDVCLHAGGDPESPALKELRRTVTEHVLVEVAGKKKRRVRDNLCNQRLRVARAG